METVLTITDENTTHFKTFCDHINPILEGLKNGVDYTAMVIDISECNFLEPGYIVVLACLIEHFHLKGLPIQMQISDNRVYRFLKSIRFYEYWDDGFDRNRYTQTSLCSSLCLWKINNSMISQYNYHIGKYFEDNFIREKNLDALRLTLSELFNNIADHSNSYVEGYTFSQYYVNDNKLVLAVCDFGLGIPATINRTLESRGLEKLSDCEALEKAMEKNFTSQSTPNNRGWGLDNISSVVRANAGQLFFLSNFASLTQNPEGVVQTFENSTSFPGTLVVVTLDTSQLPVMEAEVEEEFIF